MGTGKKSNNRTVYPMANHQPRHLANLRKTGAMERQEAYDKLSLEEKINRLPPEPYSAKQRAKLMAKLEAKNNGQSKETVEDTNKQKKGKK